MSFTREFVDLADIPTTSPNASSANNGPPRSIDDRGAAISALTSQIDRTIFSLVRGSSTGETAPLRAEQQGGGDVADARVGQTAVVPA